MSAPCQTATNSGPEQSGPFDFWENVLGCCMADKLPKRMKWESLTERYYISANGDDSDYQKYLEARGRDGWALLAVNREKPIDPSDLGTVYCLRFNRPVSERPNPSPRRSTKI